MPGMHDDKMIDLVLGEEKTFSEMSKFLGIELLGLRKDKKLLKGNYNKTPFTAFRSDGSEKILIEQGKLDLVFDFENVKKDKIHRRGSNLDKALAALIAKKGVMVGFCLSSLMQKPKDCAKILGRMRHNYKICKKAGCKTAIFTLANEPYGLRDDLKPFGILLGMHPSEAKKAVFAIKDHLEFKSKVISGKAIPGVEIE